MIVISKAAPLTSLARIGQLGLLEKLYGHVLVPPAVSVGLVWADQADESLGEILDLTWIEAREVGNAALATALGAMLDDEEAEALALAVDLSADWLLLESPRARALAGRFDIPVLGLMGVLVAAKRAGHLSALRPILEDLQDLAGTVIDPALYRRVLEAAGE
jgi:predicted nucleic acid-binding protein